MSLDKQKSLEAMRTFARDVTREQGDSEQAKKAVSDLPKIDVPKKDSTPVPTPVPRKSIKTDIKAEPVVKKKEKEDTKTEKKIPAEPAHIPAFHELQKAVKTDIKAEPVVKKKEKEDTKKKGITPTKPTGGGTIITDNKKSNRSFFSELQKSIASWFKDIKKSFTPAKKHTYEVSKTERRKGVVQKATSKTGTIFSADNETLREQIKARQRAEKHEHDDDINWSPYTEPGYPLLEGDEAESIDPRVLKVSVTQKTHSMPKPVIKSTEKIAELQEKVEEPLLPPVEEEVVEEPAPTPEPEPVKEPEVEEPLNISEVIAEAKSESSDTDEPLEDTVPEEEESEEEEDVWKLEEANLQDTNILALLFVGAILAIGIFAFVIFGIFGVGKDTPANEAAQPIAAMYAGATLENITISDYSFNELVNKINLALIEDTENTTTEYQFTNSLEQALPGGALMNTIQTTTNDGFSDTVTAVRFVHTDTGERALVLSTPDGTVARGGMLNWEDTLYADIGMLLDIQNGIPLSSGQYVDTQFGTLDIRALVFDTNTLLVYTIINETDVIIASDLNALAPYSQN